MKELPKKIISQEHCWACDGTGDSPYHDIYGNISECELCKGKGWVPEILHLDI